MKEVKDGMELPLRVNSFRKMQLASDAMASERLVRAPYMLAQLVSRISPSTIRNRLLRIWSDISFRYRAVMPDMPLPGPVFVSAPVTFLPLLPAERKESFIFLLIETTIFLLSFLKISAVNFIQVIPPLS